MYYHGKLICTVHITLIYIYTNTLITLYYMWNSNLSSYKKAQHAAIILVAIRKFRVKESGLFGRIPKQLVHYIANDVLDSYIEEIW